MNNVSRWDPAREYVSLREPMSRLMEDSFVGAQTQGSNGGGPELRLPIEAYTTDHEIVVKAAVPGLKPENVDITIEGDTLTLRGEFPRPVDNVNYLMAERAWGRF